MKLLINGLMLAAVALAFAQANAMELQRGDLKSAIAEAQAELREIASSDPDAFDMDNLEETGVVAYMCDPQNGSYSAELDRVCIKAGGI